MKILAFLHFIILLVAISSPFWIDAWVVLIGFLLYFLLKLVFKGCFLTNIQFGNKHFFTAFYLIKIFKLKIQEQKLARYLDWILAPSIPAVAFVIQYIFHFRPMINVW
jgi:hypothetical protein